MGPNETAPRGRNPALRQYPRRRGLANHALAAEPLDLQRQPMRRLLCYLPPRLSCCFSVGTRVRSIPPLSPPSALPWALTVASAVRVRSLISSRSFCTNAA
jgi:hypothetical protein